MTSDAAVNLEHQLETETQLAVQNAKAQPQQRRIESVDYLKGLAMLAVIAIHTSGKSVGYFRSVDALLLANLVINVFSHFAVPLFVLLAGFVLALKHDRIDSLRSFYVKRLKAIVPPYLVYSLVYLALAALTGTAVTLRHAVYAIATASSNGILWFIALIVQLYLLYPILIGIHDRLAAKRTLLFLAGALLIQSLWAVLRIVALDSAPFQGPAILDPVFVSHLFYFAVGIVVGRRYESIQWKAWLGNKAIWLAVLVTGLLTALTSRVWLTGLISYGSYADTPAVHFLLPVLLEPVLYLCTGLILLRLATHVLRKRGALTDFFSKVGQNSLGVYLIHYVFLMALVSLLALLGITSENWLFFPIVFVGTLALSVIAVRLLSYLPYSELAVGVHRLPRASAPSSGG